MLLTRTVLRRKKLAQAVLAAIRVHGPRVVAKLEELVSKLRQEGQQVPNYSGDLADLENQLVDAYNTIEASDDVHIRDLARDGRLRRLRNQATKSLQKVLLKMSQTIDSSYGPQTAEETLGLGTGLREIPDQIYDLGRRARDILSTEDFVFEGEVLQGVGLDPAELRAGIEGPLAELAGHLETQREGLRQTELTRKVKLEAIESFDATFTAVATWLKGLFLAAGEVELAKRIRPKVPAAAKKSEDEKVVEVDDKTGEEKEVDPEASSETDSEPSSSAPDSDSSSTAPNSKPSAKETDSGSSSSSAKASD